MGEDEAAPVVPNANLVAPRNLKTRTVWLAGKLTAAIAARPRLASARIAVAIFDLVTGKELFAHRADLGMNLASNAKLLTSTAAVATLGGGFRWRTSVYVDDLDDTTGVAAGDLYVRGRGDPTLTAADFDALARDIAARGVRKIDGQLVVDGAYFDNVTEPPHYNEQPLETAAFRAPIASFAVGRSAVTVTAVGEPSKSGKPATVRLDPDSGGYVRLGKATVNTAATGHTNIMVSATPKPDHVELDVAGSIRVTSGRFEFRRRVDDPTRFAVEVFRKALADHGVKFKRSEFRSGPVPTTSKLIAWHDSASLAAIIRDMNKFSDNYAAECVFKTLGAETRSPAAPATWADGAAAVARYLASIGIRPGSYRSDNGSGLFGASEVSAHQVVSILAAAYHDFRIWPDLVASLPVGGIDGTLAKRWNGHPAKGRVRAKTGTLDKVTSLAGFIGADTAHPMAFAILVNDIPTGQRPASRAMGDDMVDAMIAYLEAGFPAR